MSNTSDVISEVVEQTGKDLGDVKLVVQATLAAIIKLSEKEPVVMRGFGSFSRRTRAPLPERVGRNVRTGLTIHLPATVAKVVLHLKASPTVLAQS